jgi:hypothetical protein
VISDQASLGIRRAAPGLPGSTLFSPYLISKRFFFLKKSVLIFLKKTFVLIRTERHVKNAYWSSREVPRYSYYILMKLEFYHRFSKNNGI